MKWLNKNKKVLICLFLLSLPALFSLFHKGFFLSDDGEWMVIRFSAFHEALSQGQFPVRFLSRLNFSYGYPVADFLYPGFMYLSEPIHLLHIGFVETIKLFLILSMLGSSLFTFLWLSRRFNTWSSALGALIYLYAPYHLFDLYKRGSVGEILAFSIVPFVLWQIEKGCLLWSSLGIALLLLSHNTMALLFLPLIIIYSFITNRSLSKTILTVLLSFGISCFFWFPAIYDLQYTVFSKTSVSDFSQYYSTPELIGIPFLLLFAFYVAFLLATHVLGKIEKKQRNLVLLFIIVGIISIFFSSSLSSTFWKLLPISFIQFPFRFLSLEIIAVAFLSAFALEVFKKHAYVAGVVFAIFVFVFSFSYLKPLTFFDKGEGFYSTNQDSTTVKNEYMPKWVKNLPEEAPAKKIEIMDGTVANEKLKPDISFSTISVKDSLVTINTIYFPGWNVFVDGKKTTINYDNSKGVMQFIVPKGVHRVLARFQETTPRLIADIVSLLSLGALVYYRKRLIHEHL